MTHVMQQRATEETDPRELGHLSDVQEREAETWGQQVLADRNTAGPPQANTMQQSVQPGKTVQRSLLGGILDGLGGALGGALLGGLIGGPIGAIVGGLAGLVGGVLIGNSLTTRSRKLIEPEMKYATDIYKTSLDYSQITINRDSLLSTGAPPTSGNTIHLRSDWGHFKEDTLDLTQRRLETLIHEMEHVWQYQNGGLTYTPLSLWAQFKAAISGKSRKAAYAYDWRGAHQRVFHGRTGILSNKQRRSRTTINCFGRARRKNHDRGTTRCFDLTALHGEGLRREGAPHFSSLDLRDTPR